MNQCPHCQVTIKGEWEICPLCATPLEKGSEKASDPYPAVPLKFDRSNVTKILLLVSLAIIFSTFLIGLIWRGKIFGLQGALFGIMTMWLVVLIIIRKRRNLAKSILYVLFSLSAICIYTDYTSGWTGWSTTFAMPIVCSAAILAMFLAVRLIKMELGDYVLYLLAAILLGMLPSLFLFFNWVSTPIPSWISIALSFVMLVSIFLYHGKEIRLELQKRLFI